MQPNIFHYMLSAVCSCSVLSGHYITNNIVDSVQQSRRTLVLVTRALLASDWCQFELQMALMEEQASFCYKQGKKSACLTLMGGSRR
jgi:hypothetical protein